MGHQLDKAKHIIQTSKTHSVSDGEMIVHILLDGRHPSDLEVDELRVLAHGYNWCSRSQEALDAINLALEKQTPDLALLNEAEVYISNASLYSNRPLPQAYEEYIDRRIGPSWYWHIRKAIAYIWIATGEAELQDYEWQIGDEILHPEALELAIEELENVLRSQAQAADDTVRELVDEMVALRESPRFASLKMKL